MQLGNGRGIIRRFYETLIHVKKDLWKCLSVLSALIGLIQGKVSYCCNKMDWAKFIRLSVHICSLIVVKIPVYRQ